MASSNIENLVSLIFFTGRTIRERFRFHAKKNNFSYIQIETLHYIFEHEKPLMKEVSSYLNITPPTTSVIVNHLVASGQLKKISDPADKRAARLEITKKGKNILLKGLASKKENMKKVLSCLSQKERENLAKILTKLFYSNCK